MKRGDFLERRLDVLRERVERGDYVISFTHTEKLRERKIGAEDIEEAIRNGVIIVRTGPCRMGVRLPDAQEVNSSW